MYVKLFSYQPYQICTIIVPSTDEDTDTSISELSQGYTNIKGQSTLFPDTTDLNIMINGHFKSMVKNKK